MEFGVSARKVGSAGLRLPTKNVTAGGIVILTDMLMQRDGVHYQPRLVRSDMHVLTWAEISAIRNALDDFIGYVSDNSCADPDCCGGPYYEQSDFDNAAALLAKYGIEWNGKTDE